MDAHDPTIDWPYMCPYCGFGSKMRGTISNHINYRHIGEAANAMLLANATCQFVKAETLPRKERYSLAGATLYINV